MIKRIVLVICLVAFFASSGFFVTNRVEAQFPAAFGAQRAPAIEVDGQDNLYLLMSVATNTAAAQTPGSQIFFTMSKDGGTTWNNTPFTKNLSKSRGEAFGPSVAVTKSSPALPYVVYHDSRDVTQVYLLKTKKKVKFKKPVNITPHDGGAFTPKVALDINGGINIVWGDTSQGRERVIFVRSADLGSTFTSPKSLADASDKAFDPEIAIAPLPTSAAGFAIYIVWDDTTQDKASIKFSRSLDGGESFSQPISVSTGSGAARECHIATDGDGRIHVVWSEVTPEGENQAFYSRSVNGGDTFSEPLNVSAIRNGEVRKPAVTTFRDTVYVAFNEDARNRQVFLVTSRDGGSSFGDPVEVSNANPDRGRAHSPAMVADSEGTLHIVWIDSSIIGLDEGLLFYGNTTNGNRIGSRKMILAFVE
jgi:hypothetical protein